MHNKMWLNQSYKLLISSLQYNLSALFNICIWKNIRLNTYTAINSVINLSNNSGKYARVFKDKTGNILIWKSDWLKLQTMNSFEPIVNNPLVLVWAANWSHRPIDKPKTIFESRPFPIHRFSIELEIFCTEKCTIPPTDKMAMYLKNVVDYSVINHTQLGHWQTKRWDNVTVTARIGRPLQNDAQTYHASTNCPLFASKNLGDSQQEPKGRLSRNEIQLWPHSCPSPPSWIVGNSPLENQGF